MKNYFSFSKGFTFIELILYISIVTIMLSALIPFAWNVIGGSPKSSTQQEVSSQARYISERLKYEIRNAVDINTDPCPSPACSNFDTNLAQDSARQLSLDGEDTNPIIFNINSGKLMIQNGSNPAVQLNSNDTNITSLIFTNYSSLDNKTKNIGFTLTVTYDPGSVRHEFQETVSLRGDAELRSN